MNKTIFSVNYDIPGYSNTYLDITSKCSLMDADIILFDPDFGYGDNTNINGDNKYRGKILYNESDSFSLKEDSDHWKKEIFNALKDSKTVFFAIK